MPGPSGSFVPLPRAFYDRPAAVVARALVGCVVSHRDPDDGTLRRARLVETEAYVGPQDLACHASKGRTRRTDVMFGPPGHAYLFLIYGMHWCFNVVTGPDAFPAAVLVRAAVALEGCDGHLSGPGAFCRAMHLDGRRYKADVCAGDLTISARLGARPRLVVSPRVNVDYAGAWAAKPLRFSVDQEPAVSRPRPFRIGPPRG